MRHQARLGFHSSAILLTALVIAHLGNSVTPAWAQGGTTLSSAAATALGEYQAIEKRAIDLQRALHDPTQQDRALVGWRTLIGDLQRWGTNHQIPLGNDYQVVGKPAPFATVAGPDVNKLCVVQHQSPPSAPAPGIQYWVTGGNATSADRSGASSLGCAYLVTPRPAPDSEDWMNGVEMAPGTHSYDIKKNKAA
jgi:hypothetical protein